MASLDFFVKSLKKSAVSKYAELIGEDDRSARRGDLMASRFGNMPSWAADDPQAFWRAAFQYERQNASVCRVYNIALPDELSIEQSVELSNRYIYALTSDKPYQAELLNSRHGVHVNPSRHLCITVSDRVDDGIERSPEQTFRRYDAAHRDRGGRRKDGCGKSKFEMGNKLKETRRVLTELQERALAEGIGRGRPQPNVDRYPLDQCS